MPWKCLVITPFGQLNRNSVYALLLWGLLLVSTSRYSVKVHRMSNLSTFTCKSASQSCLRIPLDCLVSCWEQSIWSSRLPQEMQRRSSRWAHTSFGISLALTMWLSGEPAVSIVSSCGSILVPRKDDGTDFGCAWIQSNCLIALEIKCYCMRLVNSCSTMLIFGSW